MAQEAAKKQTVEFKSAPSWVWLGEPNDAQQIVLRREFTLEGKVEQSFVAATADNQCNVFINEQKATSSDDWAQLAAGDIGHLLKPGVNVISITSKNDGGPAGVIAAVYVRMENGKTLELVTDASWKGSSNTKGAAWRKAGFDDSTWTNVNLLGLIGDSKLPWSANIDRDALRSAFGSGSGGEFTPEIAKNAQVPPGFKIEKIFQVPRSMGSWVSLTTGPQGRLFASDQDGAGIFMITPGDTTRPTKVEKLPVKLSGAHGLLWAFDSLYAVVNGAGSGLHRYRRT